LPRSCSTSRRSGTGQGGVEEQPSARGSAGGATRTTCGSGDGAVRRGRRADGGVASPTTVELRLRAPARRQRAAGSARRRRRVNHAAGKEVKERTGWASPDPRRPLLRGHSPPCRRQFQAVNRENN
jgi:hypothetical protein